MGDYAWRIAVVAAAVVAAWFLTTAGAWYLGVAAIVAAGAIANRAWVLALPPFGAIVWVSVAAAIGKDFEWDNGTVPVEDALLLTVGIVTIVVVLPLALGLFLRSIADRALEPRGRGVPA